MFATDQSSFNPTNKPHALRAALTNQDVFPEVTQSIEYAPFDKVCHISEGGNTLSYDYGFDHQRIKMTETVNGISRQKFYLNNCEVITTDNSRKELTFISGPIGVFAVVENNGNTSAIHYIHKDHLGSWTTITNGIGQVEQEASFDAWGNLRNPETWCVDASITPMFDRGYTGHEHLRGFGLINMNGRMYDPVMSSFLSVDRYVQQPENSQGFNRYAYCMYNPLKYVDPSGWLMSRPSGSGGIPPQFTAPQPVAVDGGYQLAVIDGMLYGGCLINTYAIDNAISSSGSTFSDEKPYFSSDRGFGNFDQERDTPSFNPSSNHGGGGGFWTGGNNTSAKEYGVSSNTLSYTVSYAGLVTGYKKSLWEKPLTRAQKAINQKKAYNTQKALKAKGITKHVKEIKATNGAKLAKASRSCALLGVGLEVADIGINHQLNTSNLVNGAVAVISIWVAPVGIVYLGVELGSWIFTGNTFSEHIDNWCKEPLYEW